LNDVVDSRGDISTLLSVRSGSGDLGRLGGNHGWNNPPVRQQAEELLAAGVATISRKSKEALHRNQRASLDSLPRNVLEIKIPATRAVNVAHKGNRDRPGIKPQVASPASPGPQSDQRGEEVGDAAAV
jgi:hypothetical protein